LLESVVSWSFKAFGTIVTGKEAKRLHFLAPIFVCVCSLLGGDVQILAEETIEGKRVHADGSFEFVIRCGNKRICIVEAKKDNLRQGMAQNLIGCETLADVDGLNIVYGIFTNYKKWYFIRRLIAKLSATRRHFILVMIFQPESQSRTLLEGFMPEE
jgi:hypothetical protein